MGLLLDPRDPVEYRIEDVEFLVKVLTQRERIRFLRDLEPVQKQMERFEADAEGNVNIPLAEMPDLLEKLEAVLLVGLAGYKEDGSDLLVTMSPDALDRIPFERWSGLFNRILEVNLVTEEDAKN